ncbi:uncharacterized protein [Triticum aestivum]|uniref:uncharacterized protein n=1 Tax=Triticum aestivum TaxID=4565 RepID=UPI001D01A8B6|nr:uncharacterized protein LOC123086723 [Triticum aestivum]
MASSYGVDSLLGPIFAATAATSPRSSTNPTSQIGALVTTATRSVSPSSSQFNKLNEMCDAVGKVQKAVADLGHQLSALSQVLLAAAAPIATATATSHATAVVATPTSRFPVAATGTTSALAPTRRSTECSSSVLTSITAHPSGTPPAVTTISTTSVACVITAPPTGPPAAVTTATAYRVIRMHWSDLRVVNDIPSEVSLSCTQASKMLPTNCLTECLSDIMYLKEARLTTKTAHLSPPATLVMPVISVRTSTNINTTRTVGVGCPGLHLHSQVSGAQSHCHCRSNTVHGDKCLHRKMPRQGQPREGHVFCGATIMVFYQPCVPGVCRWFPSCRDTTTMATTSGL